MSDPPDDGILARLIEIEKGDGSVCQRDVNIVLARVLRRYLESLPDPGLMPRRTVADERTFQSATVETFAELAAAEMKDI